MADINFELNQLESKQIAQSSPNFDADILPGLASGNLAEAPIQIVPADSVKPSEPQSVEMNEIQVPGWPTGEAGAKKPLSAERRSIVDAAESAIGTQPWKSDERAGITNNGALAGGLNMSTILRSAGYSGVDAAHIRGANGVEDQLVNNYGFKKGELGSAKPGDLYIAPMGHSASIVGIIGENKNLYTHSPHDGTVRKGHIALRQGGYVLSPPEKGN